MSVPPVAYECAICRRTTTNPEDVRNSYCPCCGSAAMPRQCEHPRLYETPIAGPPGGKSDWLDYRTLCPHGFTHQQVVRPPANTIPMEVVVGAVVGNHHRQHGCTCLEAVLERYAEIARNARLRDDLRN